MRHQPRLRRRPHAVLGGEGDDFSDGLAVVGDDHGGAVADGTEEFGKVAVGVGGRYGTGHHVSLYVGILPTYKFGHKLVYLLSLVTVIGCRMRTVIAVPAGSVAA